jgi:DNA transposition AAA+ family ATPase
MPQHFLNLPGAATLTTKQYQLTGRIVADLVHNLAMGVIHGPAGTGKTYAVEAALEDVETAPVVQCTLSFQSAPTMFQITQELFRSITGADPRQSASRFDLTRMLIDLLTGPARLLVIDEAQRLTGHCLELIRHLHDHRSTRFSVLYVGGDGCWEALSREPMLASRIFRRLPFQPISRETIPGLIRGYHPIYAKADDEVLALIDDAFAHGTLRRWAVFTHTAGALCVEAGRDHIDDAVIGNAYTQLGSGIHD